MRARERSKAAPRARGAPDTFIPDGRLARTYSYTAPHRLTRRKLARGSGPFPTRKGCPRIARAHPRRQAAPGLQSKRCCAPEAA